MTKDTKTILQTDNEEVDSDNYQNHPFSNAKHWQTPLKNKLPMSKTKRSIFCRRTFDKSAAKIVF
jgi:hypothetical protein